MAVCRGPVFLCLWSLFFLSGDHVWSVRAAGPLGEEERGEGLNIKVLYRPDDCVESAQANDVIHYHYVGRLTANGKEFGKSFDYNTPYIVSLGNGLIIQGMDRGLVGACLWERRRITFPARLGYGSAGVGEKIPPNSSLTFYIRMVKILRNGKSLGQDDQGFASLYGEGISSYSRGEHNAAIALMESAIPLYQQYKTQTIACIQQCRNNASSSSLQLTTEQTALLSRVAGRMPFVTEYLKMAATGRCVYECKREAMGEDQAVDTREAGVVAALAEMNENKHYSYLQFSYYQVKDEVEGAKCAFTHYFSNPDNEDARKSVDYFRDSLAISDTNFTLYREPGTSPQQLHYSMGSDAYYKQEWLNAVDNFEQCYSLYCDDLQQCKLYCEDTIAIDMTNTDFNSSMDSALRTPDSMDMYSLMGKAIQQVVQCRMNCYKKLSTVNGVQNSKGYLASIFNFLQYAYYSVGRLNDAAECVASYLALEPSDHAMNKNSFYYKSNEKVPEEMFVPRQEVVTMYREHQGDSFLLDYIVSGSMPKRRGVRGDTSTQFDYRTEL